MMSDELVKIRGEFTPDPQVCRFNVNRPLLDDWSAAFDTPEDSMGSRLIDRLFAVEDVGTLRVSGSGITVTKTGDEPWPKVAQRIIPVIKECFESGETLLSEALLAKIQTIPDESDMHSIIELLFKQSINPSLESHGGWVRLDRIENRNVYLELGGGCQGCAASQATLKNGIEQAIRDALPQVLEIVDVTDHEAGSNPYYTS
jgi:Fe-S cluster biogenesis protein NfuA